MTPAPSSQSPSPNGAITLETWIKTTDTGVKGIFGKQAYQLLYGAGRFRAADATDVTVTASTPVNDGNWHHLAATASASGIASIYVDGAPSGNVASGHTLLATGADPLIAGSPMKGSLDEIRISNSVRSADWIAAGFNNQNSPGTFYSIYPENADSVIPASSLLSSGQTQQFTAALMAAPAVGVTTPLTLLGAAATPSPAESVAVNGNYAYVCGNSDLTVFDVSNPANPHQVATLSPWNAGNEAKLFCNIQGGKLMVFDGPANTSIAGLPTFSAFSLANPAQPQFIKSTTTQRQFFTEPSYSGNIAFEPTGALQYASGNWLGAYGQVVAYDVSDVTNPLILSLLKSNDVNNWGEPSGAFFGGTLSNSLMYIGGSTATSYFDSFYGRGTGKLLVADVTDPANMSVLTEVDVAGTVDIYPPAIQGSTAVSIGHNGYPDTFFNPNGQPIFNGHVVVTTFDLADPRNPVVLKTIATPYHSRPN